MSSLCFLVCLFFQGIGGCYSYCAAEKSEDQWGNHLTHLLKVSEVSTGPCPCSTRLLMPRGALRGLRTDKYLSMCEWRKRDDSQPVSCVWGPGIKQGPAQWHRVTQAMTSTHTHILPFWARLPSLNLLCVSHTHTHMHAALSANSCQRHHPLGRVVSLVHTVIGQLTSSAFSCLYLDNSLHPNELCQDGIWHKPSIKHSWQTLKLWKSGIPPCRSCRRQLQDLLQLEGILFRSHLDLIHIHDMPSIRFAKNTLSHKHTELYPPQWIYFLQIFTAQSIFLVIAGCLC